MRENARTGRTFEEVLAKAIFEAFQEGYREGFGADADHLKSIEDAHHAAELRYTFFTCAPSDSYYLWKDSAKQNSLSYFMVRPNVPLGSANTSDEVSSSKAWG